MSPIARTRALRGGASAALVVGSTLSHSAAAGYLERVISSKPEQARDLVEAALDDAVETVSLPERLLGEVLRRTEPANKRASKEYAANLLARHGEKAMDVFRERVNGLNARFSSVDDEERAGRTPAVECPRKGAGDG